MTGTRDTGGAVFPSPAISQDQGTGQTIVHQSDGGMTLRDYFAAKAMAGSLAGEPGSHLTAKILARGSYQYADAMLKARSE